MKLCKNGKSVAYLQSFCVRAIVLDFYLRAGLVLCFLNFDRFYAFLKTKAITLNLAPRNTLQQKFFFHFLTCEGVIKSSKFVSCKAPLNRDAIVHQNTCNDTSFSLNYEHDTYIVTKKPNDNGTFCSTFICFRTLLTVFHFVGLISSLESL